MSEPLDRATVRRVARNLRLIRQARQRQSRRWSQVGIAAALNVSQPQLHRLERGIAPMTAELVRQLAAALSVAPATLLSDPDQIEQALNAPEDTLA